MTASVMTITGRPGPFVPVDVSCPHCGAELPLPRPVLAARLRCLEPACRARLKVRAGRVLWG